MKDSRALGRTRTGTCAVLITLGSALLLLVLPGAGSTAAGSAGPRCGGKLATQVGSPGDNTIIGTAHRDVIVGAGGKDKILGRGGRDLICGGAGKDDLLGGRGNDSLKGGGANDDLNGGSGSDGCTQGAGQGTVSKCEADLSIDVSGPDTAGGGVITYVLTVKNKGPSPVEGYTLLVNQDNHHLQCDNVGFDDGLLQRPALGAGKSKIDSFQVDCVIEGDPPRTVYLDFQLVTTSPTDDLVSSNDGDRQTTTVE